MSNTKHKKKTGKALKITNKIYQADCVQISNLLQHDELKLFTLNLVVLQSPKTNCN